MIPLMKPSIGDEEKEELDGVLSSGWLAQGPKVAEFEEAVAGYLAAKHIIATSSCTTALSLAAEILFDGGKGEVAIPNFTFPATANVVARLGFRTRLIDVDESTWAITGETFNEAIRAGWDSVELITMDPFGLPCGFHGYSESTIEDAATAFGSMENGKMVGHSGKAVCFSFHPRKVITTGEGGCIATDDEEVASKARTIRDHGKHDGEFVVFGTNCRMSSLQAAVGVAQVKKAEKLVTRRMEQAQYYDELLTGLVGMQKKAGDFSRSNRQSYVVRVPMRDSVIARMKEKGIETQIGTYALSLLPAFKGVARAADLSISEQLAKDTLALPLFDGMTQEQQDFVVKSLIECLEK